ncbi:CBS domain-containing protein [Leptolyngbya sp. NIES-2104]|uniref:CBS domain-containing protein n=1 Tax=Leptolyngbya sp. NIES-2104 TaxID=1552121 RepID=UPI0006EC68D9|nr:CBS domain-containing protein [Leptolyngbya sp. NIES-2104]GAP97573.1 two-component hybrid sensor and regulator [Leptolyngbya sp. NIES-2104]
MVTSFDRSIGTPPIAEAVDRYPLIVSPDARLSEVAALMYKTAHPFQPDPLCGARSSCVLVMQDEQLSGIFTERDLVQLTALGISMESTRIADVMHYPVLSMTEASLHNVFAALFLFRRHRIRHLAIVNDQSRLVGVISLDSIRHILRPTNLLKIRRVAEVMSRNVITAMPNTSVLQLTELMATHQISCIVIVESFSDEDEMQHPIGIVTERDIVQFQASGLDIEHTQASKVMSTPLFVLSPEDSLWTAHQQMEQRQVRRLVVSWNWGKDLGIITQTSLLRVFDPIEMHDVIETLQRTIQQLGLDPNKILESAIDHDAHLPAPSCSLHQTEIPNLNEFLKGIESQVEHLIKTPELTAESRFSVLLNMLSEIRQTQGALQH